MSKYEEYISRAERQYKDSHIVSNYGNSAILFSLWAIFNVLRALAEAIKEKGG